MAIWVIWLVASTFCMIGPSKIRDREPQAMTKNGLDTDWAARWPHSPQARPKHATRSRTAKPHRQAKPYKARRNRPWFRHCLPDAGVRAPRNTSRRRDGRLSGATLGPRPSLAPPSVAGAGHPWPAARRASMPAIASSPWAAASLRPRSAQGSCAPG
jgi:hypothetical protein